MLPVRELLFGLGGLLIGAGAVWISSRRAECETEPMETGAVGLGRYEITRCGGLYKPALFLPFRPPEYGPRSSLDRARSWVTRNSPSPL